MTQQILLVDDEEGIRKVLGISLADVGYEVLSASTGEEALHVWRNERPPIVLTDIKMPGMDGIELLQRIKEESPDTEVIMLTGHGDLSLAIKSLQLEAADFVTKPINDDALEIALKRAQERIWLKRKLRVYTEELERLVEEKTQQLLQAERLAAIGQTVAAIAHAVKNIIGGLNGGIFVFEKGMELKNEDYITQGWEMVKGNVEKIKKLALDLLNYAKEREPEYRLCDPNELSRQVFQLMDSKARECGINLMMDLDPDLDYIFVDPEAIHCCLLNLLTNAVDACSDLECMNKPGEIIIRTCKRNGWAVEYEVIDNGCGMDQETQERIFQNFFSTKASKGTGLGLMIAKKIVCEHQGTISLETEKGRGTRFIVRLPKKDSPETTKNGRGIVSSDGVT